MIKRSVFFVAFTWQLNVYFTLIKFLIPLLFEDFKVKKTVWVLLDNRMGSVGQLKGVVQAMDMSLFDVEEKQIEYNMLSALPNLLKGASLLGVKAVSGKDLKAPYPDVVLAASRRVFPVARYIKKKSGGMTKIVQLLHPGNAGLKDVDLLILSEHDRMKKQATDTIYITGVPHRVTKSSLEKARGEWEKEFSYLPKPLTALVIGGAIKGKPFTAENAKLLGEKVREFKKENGGGLLITSSKRTGREAEKLIMEELRDIPSFEYLWGSKGDNPYLGYLAVADNIIVTGDSVSMCSEACGTGKPVFIFSGRNWLTKKHERFIKSLFDEKYATELEMKNVNFQPSRILDVAGDVARKIKELLNC